MKTVIHLQNYKKIKDLLAEFESGNVYFVKASNNSGKTSFLQALLTTIQARNPNRKALSFGASEGSITTKILEFKGQDNENYTIRFDMAEGKDDKFVIVRPDTTIGKKVSDITSIFKYNAFTVDEWFAWGLTAEGRRKQAKILLAMLPEQAQKEFADLEAKINANNGTLFEQRRKANAIYESRQAAYNLIQFDVNEMKMLEQGEKWAADSQALIREKENTLKLLAGSAPALVHVETLKATIQRFEEDSLRVKNDHETWLTSTQSEIDRLQARIDELQKDMVTQKAEFDSKLAGYVTARSEAEQALKTAEAALPKDLPKIEDIEKRIADRKPYDDIYQVAIAKQTRQAEAKKELQEAFDTKEKLTADLEEGRKRKLQIIQEAKLPVSNISIQSDEVLYVDPETGNELPFSEENVSYSRGGYIVAQIMLAVNKDLPILMVGKAAEYDQQSLDRLAELAAANDAIVILDKVMQTNQELSIECYEGKVIPTLNTVSIVPDAVKAPHTPQPEAVDNPFQINL